MAETQRNLRLHSINNTYHLKSNIFIDSRNYELYS